MNRISPKKLLHSKWTAARPQNQEKHFMVIDVEFDEDANVVRCLMQAVINKREFDVDWQSLKRVSVWRAGWR